MLVYDGAWESWAIPGAVNGTHTYSNEADASVTLTFNGTGAALYTGNRGKAQIYLDGKLVDTVDLYSSTAFRAQKIYEVKGLDYKEHTLKLIVSGEKNEKSEPMSALMRLTYTFPLAVNRLSNQIPQNR